MASRPTKYAHVVQGLPKFEGEMPERLQLLIALREEILQTPFDELTDWNIDIQILRHIQAVQVNIQNLIAHAKRATKGQRNASAYTRAYADARLVVESIKEWLASAQLLSDAYERMMTDQMEAEGIRSLNFEDGGGVSTSQEPYGKVIDKEAFRLWCIAPAEVCRTCGGGSDAPAHAQDQDGFYVDHRFNPGGGLEKQLQLWPGTMNALAKERTLAGEPPPDGVEVTVKTMVRLNKA